MKPAVYFLYLLGSTLALPSTMKRDAIVYPPGDRIMAGGSPETAGSVPYHAALMVNGLSLCGGSLISSSYVLTAAYCTIRASYVDVRLGLINLLRPEPTTIVVTSSNIINHEHYQDYFYFNNIALIRLSFTLILNKAIQPIPVAPPTAPSYDGSTAYLTGWYLASKEPDLSADLRGVNLTIIPNEECARFPITEDNICTSGTGGVGACERDVGGPLVVDGVLVGVVSFLSFSDCTGGYSTAYSRISSFRDWITEKARI